MLNDEKVFICNLWINVDFFLLSKVEDYKVALYEFTYCLYMYKLNKLKWIVSEWANLHLSKVLLTLEIRDVKICSNKHNFVLNFDYTYNRKFYVHNSLALLAALLIYAGGMVMYNLKDTIHDVNILALPKILTCVSAHVFLIRRREKGRLYLYYI